MSEKNDLWRKSLSIEVGIWAKRSREAAAVAQSRKMPDLVSAMANVVAVLEWAGPLIETAHRITNNQAPDAPVVEQQLLIDL